MSKTRKVLDIQLDGFHLTCILNREDNCNPFRVYREWNGHRRQIAKYADFYSVICFIKDLYREGADSFPLWELVEWSDEYHGCGKKKEQKLFGYYITQRPPKPGAMPKSGLREIMKLHALDERKFVSEINREAYAVLFYDRPLTEAEISDYELVPKC